jgi:hypothetical protein
MPSKITAHGRTWKSPDWKESRRRSLTEADHEALNAPPILNAPRAIEAQTITEEGVRYRVVPSLDPQEGWCLASQLIEHFGIDWPELRQWALKGLLDCATAQGSTVRRYRPAVPVGALLAHVAAYKAKPRATVAEARLVPTGPRKGGRR